MFRFSVKIGGEFYKTTWDQATAFMSLMRMGIEDKHAFYAFMKDYLMYEAIKSIDLPSNGFLDFDQSVIKGRPVVFGKDGKETDYFDRQYDQFRERLQV